MRRLVCLTILVTAIGGCANGNGFNLFTGWLAQSDEDYQTAAAMFREAAEQGDPKGQNSLGELYEQGQGVAQDYVRAASWYRRAARAGHAGGQFNLGRMYRDGKGVPQDFVRAYAWMNLAAIRDNLGSLRRERDRLLQRLSPQQVAEAQALSRQFHEQYGRPDSGASSTSP